MNMTFPTHKITNLNQLKYTAQVLDEKWSSTDQEVRRRTTSLLSYGTDL